MREVLAAAVMVVVWGAGAARGQSIDRLPMQARTPTVTVDIHDHADVPKWTMSRAVAEASAIFDGTDVRLEWRIRRWSRAETRPQGAPVDANAITVQIVPAVRDLQIAQDPTILGAVPGAHIGGRIAYLFSARIDVVAKRNSVAPGALLGIVLAHELGHVLLPGRPHSPHGIMRPFCAAQQIQEILSGHHGFSAAETQLIRRSVSIGPVPE
jgi:hypothetical protein